jgi:hypothetical protein
MRDTFGEGVSPGGLTDADEIKILICYLLKSIARPLSFDNLNMILQHDGLCNYFEFAGALRELLISGHVDLIKQDREELYKTTPLGKETAAMFERRLPASIREKAVNTAIRLLAQIKRESENRIEIAENPSGGFYVTCSVLDRDEALMTVKLLVGDRAQAQAAGRRFQQNPEIVYKGMLALMTGDTAVVAELISAQASPESDTQK